MASGHLVTDCDLSLLCNINLGKLHHAIRKFVTDLDLVNRSLVDCGSLLVSDAIIVDKIPDHIIGVSIIGPAI